jgi:HEAT repeat protein
MNTTESRLSIGLAASPASVRLEAVMAAGMRPAPEDVEVLIARCAVEPDFYVRDMLTWALTRHDAAVVFERLLIELTSEIPQARSQALHTLSKIGDRRAWFAITPALLQDADDEVARAAWRTATGFVPDGEANGLAEILATQFNRGGRDVQKSLSRAFAVLGEVALPVVERMKSSRDPGVRQHAIATEWLMQHPEKGYETAIAEAQRIMVLLGAPGING